MKCFCQSLKEITCRMLFFSSPTPHLEVFASEQCQKLIVSNRYHQCPLKAGWGGVWKKPSSILPALAPPSWSHLIVGGTLWGEGILVGWWHERYIFFESDNVEILFQFSHLRWFIHLHCSTLASVAINRSCKCSTNNKLGLDPWLLALVGCSPNSKCNVINLSHTRQQPDTASDKQDKNVFKSL